MDELLKQLKAARIRCLLAGGQAMRLRDEENFARLNAVLGGELDMPLVPLGPRGENFVQTYQTRWGVLQFHLGLPGVPSFDEAERRAVIRQTESGTPIPCLSGPHLLAAKRAANRPQDQADIEFLRELERLGKL